MARAACQDAPPAHPASYAGRRLRCTALSVATLELDIGGGAGRLAVAGTVTLAGGTLNVVFVPGHVPSVGDTLDVIGAGKLQGRFTTISVMGFKVTPTYATTGLLLHIDG